MTFVFTLRWEAWVFWAVTGAWLAEAALVRSRARGRAARAPGVAGIALAVLGALGLAGALHELRLGQLDGAPAAWLRRGALVAYAGGVALRWWGARTLARLGAFTREVRVAADMPLAERGPYRLWAHPLYAGLWLASVGLCGLCANVPGLVGGAALTALAIGRRARAEEVALEEALGVRYTAWRRGRWRLWPGVW